MKSLLQFVLKLLARATLAKYRPRIVGITGSVGKTGTKEAVAAVLSRRWRVGQSHKNFNNEIGLPLAILGEPDSGYGNPLIWLAILVRALVRLMIRNPHYPELLVLEYAVDHPGDMAYLLSVARPEVGVVTAIAPTHLEFMGTVEAVAREKGQLVTSLPPSGTAVLNADDEMVAALRTRVRAKVMTYGFEPGAQVRAESVDLNIEAGQVKGVSFKLIAKGNSIPLVLYNVVGRPPVAVVLAAAAVGLSFGVSPLELASILPQAPRLPGRLRLIPGIKRTMLIDDSYNSSPRALAEALDVLAKFPVADGARRWAILGDMLELGADSESLHQQAGARLARLGIDYLVTVGERSRGLAHGARQAGLNPDHAWHFAASAEAGLFVQDRLEQGDVALIKGSQGVRCEKVTKELMAEPLKASELLVRQHKPWA